MPPSQFVCLPVLMQFETIDFRENIYVHAFRKHFNVILLNLVCFDNRNKATIRNSNGMSIIE